MSWLKESKEWDGKGGWGVLAEEGYLEAVSEAFGVGDVGGTRVAVSDLKSTWSVRSMTLSKLLVTRQNCVF